MGVKGLFPYLRHNAPNCITQISIEALRGKRVAIDGNLLLFREYASPWLDVLQPAKHALWCIRLARLCRQYAISPIVVFDSPESTPAKARERVGRTLRRAKAQAELSGTKDRAARLQELGSTMLAMHDLSLQEREQIRLAVIAARALETESTKHKEDTVGRNLTRKKRAKGQDQEMEDDAIQRRKQTTILAKQLIRHLQTISSFSVQDASSELALLMKLIQSEANIPTEELQELQAATAELVDRLSRRVVRVRPRDVNKALQCLRYFRIPAQLSPDCFEGECTAAHFVRMGFADFVATEDSDVLVYGVPQLRGFMGVHHTREDSVSLGDMKLIDPIIMRRELKSNRTEASDETLSKSEFLDLAILCGTDFTQSISGLGIQKAALMMHLHKSIETALPHIAGTKIKAGPNKGKPRYNVHDSFMSDVEIARKIFTTYPVNHAMLSPKMTSLDSVNRSFANFSQLSSNPEKWEEIEAKVLKSQGLERCDIDMLDQTDLYIQHQRTGTDLAAERHPFNDWPGALRGETVLFESQAKSRPETKFGSDTN